MPDYKDQIIENLQKEVEELKEQIKEISTESRSLPWAENDSEIILNVSEKKADEIQAKIIDGRRFLIVPIDNGEHTVINGIDTEL